MSLRKTAVVVGTALLPTLSMAHEGHEAIGSGFLVGLTHPLMGIDHLLAMVAVGLWGAHIGGNARWQLPLAFVVTMFLGTFVGVSGFAFAGTEMMIVLSIVAFGLALTYRGAIKPAVAIVACSIFAVFHGVAHGAEAPASAYLANYIAGFIAATALLHIAGLAIGSKMKLAHERVIQITGFLILLAGGVLGLA